jgi:hypothetical protein
MAGFLIDVAAGLTAMICLGALFFALLEWRTNTPEVHLNLGHFAEEQKR